MIRKTKTVLFKIFCFCDGNDDCMLCEDVNIKINTTERISNHLPNPKVKLSKLLTNIEHLMKAIQVESLVLEHFLYGVQ